MSTYPSDASHCHALTWAYILVPECRAALHSVVPEMETNEDLQALVKEHRLRDKSFAVGAYLSQDKARWDAASVAVFNKWREIFPDVTIAEMLDKVGRRSFSEISIGEIMSVIVGIKEDETWRNRFFTSFPELEIPFREYIEADNESDRRKVATNINPMMKARWYYIKNRMIPDHLAENAQNRNPLSYTPPKNPREAQLKDGAGRVFYVEDNDELVTRKILEIRRNFRSAQLHLMPPKEITRDGVTQNMIRIFLS